LRHHSLWLTQRVTLSRWRIMFRPFVGLATFNCASCVLSLDLSQPTQPRRLCMLSLHVDLTTATHCCSGITDSLFRRLQSVQNAADHGIWRRDHITPVLRDLHWLPVRRRVDYKLALLVYKSLHGLVPSYLADDCILATSDKFRHHLRSADVDTCIVPSSVLATGVSPLPAPVSGTAYRRNCDGQSLSLPNSVDHWRHFCLRRDSRDGGALVTQ